MLLGAPPCELLGIGNGGPKRQPAVVQFWNLQLPKLQAPGAPQHALPALTPPEHVPPEHVPPGRQVAAWHALLLSGPPMHTLGQSKLLIHGLLWFEPPEHRLPLDVSADAVPLNVSVLPSQQAWMTLKKLSGTAAGCGTATLPPPKYRPPHVSGKKFGFRSASRWPQFPAPMMVLNLYCNGVPPVQLHAIDGVGQVLVVVDVLVVVVVLVVVGHG